MLYERRYSDDYLKEKYILTSEHLYNMHRTVKKYGKRLEKLTKYYHQFSNHFKKFNPFVGICYAGRDTGKFDEGCYEDNRYRPIMGVGLFLYFVHKNKKDFREWTQDVDNGPVDSNLFYTLDYLEYAYPIAIGIAKENIRKIHKLRWESFLDKIGL